MSNTTTESPYEVLTAYQKSAAVMAATQTGIYESLGDTPKTAVDIAARSGLNVYATGVLLDALATCGYVGVNEDGLYEHNDFSRAFTMDGPSSLARIVHKEAFFYGKWANLRSSVKSGNARLAPFAQRCESAPQEIKVFLSALNDIAAMGAPGVLDAAGMPESGTLLDFGGGMGGYAVKIARRHPGLKVTLLDCPHVAALCREHLELISMSGKIKVVEGDLFDAGTALKEEKFDIVFVSHIIHDYPPEKASKVISGAAQRVKEGGRLYLLDVPKPDTDGSTAEALFNVMMLVEAPGGRTHSNADICRWMEASGLKLIKKTKLYFGALYEARKS
jgi:3-hydroxy-5-methyl-1-naphthoate 3-O-methyltransferase